MPDTVTYPQFPGVAFLELGDGDEGSAAGIVESFDPFEDRPGELDATVPGVAVQEFALHGRSERLDVNPPGQTGGILW